MSRYGLIWTIRILTNSEGERNGVDLYEVKAEPVYALITRRSEVCFCVKSQHCRKSSPRYLLVNDLAGAGFEFGSFCFNLASNWLGFGRFAFVMMGYRKVGNFLTLFAMAHLLTG